MKITDVTLTLFAWDIPATTYGRHTGRFSGKSRLGLLTVRTDEGVEGHAFLGSAQRGAHLDGESLIQFLKPVVMGQDPLDRERLYHGLWQRGRATTYRAIGAMDVALWDTLMRALSPAHAAAVRYTFLGIESSRRRQDMAYKPVALDHVNIFVRNAERSHKWYTDVFGLHTQDTMTFPGTSRLRAAFLACDRDHAHDIALFEVGEDAPGPQKKQVGLNHVAWRMGTLEDLAEMYQRLKAKNVPISVSDHTVSIGIYFSDPDGNGLEVYYEQPRSEWKRERPFSEQGAKGRFPGLWNEVIEQAPPAFARA